ncbi:uncharacterized protein LOC118436279 isoform X2 [Folsomia candida]|uniref:uncharacterized protein LOC118436279 isoform X2 n=1 Tax=Folsomia candida TaxID=158441 RepID=UPI0016051F4E|nr:uncharacterized protein LOC118436279 isoform X2 [Folsomia candida]
MDFCQADTEAGFVNYYSHRFVFRIINQVLNPSHYWSVRFTLSIINTMLSFILNVFSNSVVFHMSGLMFLLTYRIGREVEDYLRDNATAGLQEVVDYYMRVKAFFVVLNGTLTLLVFVFVVGVILFFSRSLLQIIEANDVATRITTGGYLCYAVFYLCLAAEGHAKLKLFGDFIFLHRNDLGYKDSTSEVLSMLSETASSPLGLKADTFLITYGLLVSIFSTVLTYTMVLVQFNAAHPAE